MSRALYLECNSGISGDMFVASLIGLGGDKDKLLRALDSLKGHHVTGFDVRISEVVKSGIKAWDFDVVLDEEHDGHDHDMEYLHSHEHVHEDGTVHSHHEHRNLSDIIHIIDHASITPGAKALAVSIFEIIAKAESKAHGLPVEQVHFHEVGAVDSIVDIVAAAVLMDDLGFEEVFIKDLTEGCGTVRCQHGILPVPVPAVVNIVSEYNMPLRSSEIKGELVTPTGAAIACAIRTSGDIPGSYKILRCGIGAGKRQYEIPSLLRAFEIETEDVSGEGDIIRLETDIDDSTGEDLGYLMEKLYSLGAREVHFTPVYMKKNRPGTEVVVICDASSVKIMEDTIFMNTTTIGIRKIRVERTVLRRFMETVDTKYGRIDVKAVVMPDGSVRRYPEYESVKKACELHNVTLSEVRSEVNKVDFNA